MAGGSGGLMGVFERQTLANGLRVLTAPMPHAQSVSCFLMFAAGSRYETPETNGIAHFAEHMFFKGTERRPTARDIGNEIDSIGGEFNAFTGKEYTGYYVRCAGEHRAIALDVLVDMLRHSKFEPEEIEREKGVIVEEMNMYFDTPRDYIGGVYDSLLYGDQPLGWDIIGRKETVRAATRETFLDYIDRWYKPARMVVGVARQDRRRPRGRARGLLGDLEPAETGEPDAGAVWRERRGPRQVHTKASDQAHLCSACGAIRSPSRPLRAPAADDGARRRHVVAALHRGARAARPRLLRLRSTTLHRRWLALLAGRRRHQPHRRGHHDDRARAQRIADEPVPADELEKARNFAKGRFVLQAREPAGADHVRAAARGARGRRDGAGRGARGLDAVTAEDVQRVAQDLIGGQG